MFDYTAGGLIRNPGEGRDTLLVSLKKSTNSTAKQIKGKEEFLARLRNENSALGQAFRDGKWDLIRDAVKKVLKQPRED